MKRLCTRSALRSVVALSALLPLILGTAAMAASRIVHFASADGTRISGTLMRPAGKGPFPAVVALHGCSGLYRTSGRLRSRHADWGRRLVRAGYVVLFPASFRSRGHGSLCRVKPRPVRHRQRIADAQGARAWLARQPFVKAGAIALLGWSNGGSTVLRAVTKRTSRGFRRAFAFYPGCRSMLKRLKARPRVPLTILIGGADDWTPPGPCIRLAKRWGIRIRVYKGAYHGFDSPRSRPRVRRGMAYSADGSGTVHVGTHPGARRKAIRDVMSALPR